MRMTNKIMQNNSLYNINNNKELQDKLSTQMSTKKKISRPSDDPVIAIRALRLRSDVSQITQYYSKNAKDAESWLKVTGDALETTAEILKSMAGLCTRMIRLTGNIPLPSSWMHRRWMWLIIRKSAI